MHGTINIKLTRRLGGNYEVQCNCSGCFSQTSSRFIKSRRRWKRPARYEKSILNVICNVADFDCGAEDSSVLGLYAVYTGKQYPTFRRNYNPSKLKPVEVVILESGCKTRRYKNHLGYSGVDGIYIYIYIYIYEFLHRIILYPQTMGVESSQNKGKRGKLLRVTVFHCMTGSAWPEIFQRGCHLK